MPPQLNSKAVLILESQPPHLGELLQVIQALNTYQFLILCISPTAVIMPIGNILGLWNVMLQPYAERVKIVTIEANMAEVEINNLPKEFKGCVYLTSDKLTYIHISSMNVPTQLIPEVMGYKGIFLRSAYRQSRAFHWLETKFKNQR